MSLGTQTAVRGSTALIGGLAAVAVLASCSSSLALKGDAGNTDDGPADAEVAFTPNAIRQRLAFWFDPTSLMAAVSKVSRWKDLSDNGNDAVQTMSSFQPSLSAASIAGLATATFPGPATFLRINDGPTMQWGRNDFLVLVVERGSAATAANAMLYQKTGGRPYDGASLYLNADKPASTKLAAAQLSGALYVVSAPPPATFVDDNVHLLGIRRSGSTLEVRVDGTLSNSLAGPQVSGTDVSVVGLDAIIGQNGYDPRPEFQQFHGEIAEMLAVIGPVSAGELANLEQYLMTRYRRAPRP